MCNCDACTRKIRERERATQEHERVTQEQEWVLGSMSKLLGSIAMNVTCSSFLHVCILYVKFKSSSTVCMPFSKSNFTLGPGKILCLPNFEPHLHDLVVGKVYRAGVVCLIHTPKSRVNRYNY